MSPKPTSSRMPTSNRADSTSACAVGPPCRARISFCSEPAFTPTRIGTPRAWASRAISFTLSWYLMLPGLMRTPAQPASSACIAYFHWKWMSATTGIVDLAAIAGSAAASSVSGTATRTMSQPVVASSAICCSVPLTSAVLVMVIDWTLIGAPPPTATLPTCTCRLRRRPSPAARSVNSSGKATDAPSGDVGVRGALCSRCPALAKRSEARGEPSSPAEGVPDGVGDVQPHQPDGQRDQQPDDQRRDRRDPAQVDRPAGDLLLGQERQVPAVQRRDRQQVDDADHDVELDQQVDEEDPLLRRGGLPGEPAEADHADRAAVARPRAAPGRLLRLQPVDQPGHDAAEPDERGPGDPAEERAGGRDRLQRVHVHDHAGGLHAEERAPPAGLVGDAGGDQGGRAALAVALVHHLDAPPLGARERGAQPAEVGDGLAVDRDDAVPGA